MGGRTDGKIDRRMDGGIAAQSVCRLTITARNLDYDDPRTTAMVSADGWSSPANDRDRDGKWPRQCVTAQDDEIDHREILNV